VDVESDEPEAASEERFRQPEEPAPATCGRPVDVDASRSRPACYRKELITREIAEPSDGLEPSTPLLTI